MLIIESKIKINIPPYQTAPTEINLYGCYQLLKLSPEVMPIASSTPPRRPHAIHPTPTAALFPRRPTDGAHSGRAANSSGQRELRPGRV